MALTTRLVLFAIVALFARSTSSTTCKDPNATVLVLGAGIAGLSAAETLSKNGIDDFLIIDQLDRIGGRVRSEKFAGGIVELGPQWLFFLDSTAPEDVQNPVLPLIRHCNVTLRPTPLGFLPTVSYNQHGENITSEVMSASNRYSRVLSSQLLSDIINTLPEDSDIPMSEGLRAAGWDPQTAIEEHTEGIQFDFPFSKPTDTAGLKDTGDRQLLLRRVFGFGGTPLNFIVTNPEGYAALPRCIANGFLTENDPRVILGTTITGVSWEDECICATTATHRQYCAPYAIVTFSVGTLQRGVVNFTPNLPLIKHLTLNQFEMANFLKIYVAFNETFWDTNVDMITYMDEIEGREYYPYFAPWGAYFPENLPILEAFLTGDAAKRVASQSLNITRRQIAGVMRNIYKEKASDPVDIIMHDFITSPFFFGDFTSSVPGLLPRQFDEMNAPCGNMYFSGEAYSFLHHSSFHGALIHGKETAERIVEKLRGPLTVTFINDSPQIKGKNISAEFRISKPASTVDCIIGPRGTRKNCGSGGQVMFSNLAEGSYVLRVVARTEGEGAERGEASVKFSIGRAASCSAHLINSGLSITGRRATVQFSSSGRPVTSFQCHLDRRAPIRCSSPLILRSLSVGHHRLRITPVCEGAASRRLVIINI